MGTPGRWEMDEVPYMIKVQHAFGVWAVGCGHTSVGLHVRAVRSSSRIWPAGAAPMVVRPKRICTVSSLPDFPRQSVSAMDVAATQTSPYRR